MGIELTEIRSLKRKINNLAESFSGKSTNHILLHEQMYFENGMYSLKTFSLDTNRITHIEEVLSARYISIDEIVEKDRAKLDRSSLGEHFSRIRTDLLDKEGNPQVFYAMESVEYIHSKM